MFVKGKTGIIFKSGIFALLWVLIVTCTMFPNLLERGNHFLSEQYNFEHVGQALLFALGIYLFDLMIQILYAVDEHLNKIFVVQILGGIAVCVFAISMTKNMGVDNIWTFLFVWIAMFYMKVLTLYMSSKTKKVTDKNRRFKI
jgi:hypothetical protein